jgi:hypothetical protein
LESCKEQLIVEVGYVKDTLFGVCRVQFLGYFEKLNLSLVAIGAGKGHARSELRPPADCHDRWQNWGVIIV